jgi:arylsulfatase A-like enzyme
MNTWPDGAMTPFRSEKNTNWEGAFRVPMVMRWPGKTPAGVVANEIVQHHDWLPTFLAIPGEPQIVEKLKTAIWWRCASTTGRSFSWSSAFGARWASGRSPSTCCGSRSFLT